MGARARRGIGTALALDAVEGAGLLAVGDPGGVEGAADDLVAHARQILDASAADEDDRVLLKVVALAGDVGGDLHAVRQPHAGDLPQRRVRLLRGHGGDARADAALLRGSPERGCLGLRLWRRAPFADKLIYGWHESPLRTETADRTLSPVC